MMKISGTEDILTVSDLSTGYPERGGSRKVITSGLTATLRRSELTCLLGPNGAGKSTLLRTLAGFQQPLCGEITILGQPLRSLSASDVSERVGVVLTERPQVMDMTVRELVGLGRAPYTGFWGRLLPEDEKRVDEALEMVGISEFAMRRVATLSDGERQKVMIAKVLAQQTPLVFLDEPTAFLDFPSKVEVMLLLKRLTRERGLGVFLSTHDLDLAFRMADRLWFMAPGLPVAVGTASEMLATDLPGRYFQGSGITYNPSRREFIIKT